MPSLAQGYGKGLLLGLQLEEAKRQRQRDELSDAFLRERLEDMRFQRKALLSQLKREEEERREAGLEKVAKGHRMAKAGVGLRDLLLKAGVTMPQAELAETEYYETEKIPSYASEWLTPPKAEKPSASAEREAREWEQFHELKRLGVPIGPPTPTPIVRKEYLERKFIPKEKESAVQKWLTAWEKHIFALKDEFGEPKFEDLSEKEKRAYFDKWAKRIPADLRLEVRKRANMDSPIHPITPAEAKPINYKGMAKGLRELEKIETQETLEAYKDQLLEHYPELDWEQLKRYFKKGSELLE